MAPPLGSNNAVVQVTDLASYNTELQGAQTEYSKAKYHKGEISIQDFLLPDDACIQSFNPDDDDDDDDDNTALPVINLQNPHRKLLREIVQATESVGFFTVTNHGVPADLIQRLEGHVRRFFELPMEAKLNARRGLSPGMCGFIAGSPMFLASRWWAESLQLDWNETRMRNVLQDTLPTDAEFEEFRADYYAYMKALGELSHEVLRLLAEGLGVPSAAFAREVETGAEQGTMRFNFYPPCPRPDKVWGLIAHRDPTVLSILHQDAVGGLQIRRNGRWLGVAPAPFSFVVMVGDILQAMSNGRLESVLHRVVTNSTNARLSMAYFCNTVADAVISVAPELVTEDQPPQYRPFSYAEYSCMPFRPSDFTSTQEYRPNRLDLYKILPQSNVTESATDLK